MKIVSNKDVVNARLRGEARAEDGKPINVVKVGVSNDALLSAVRKAQEHLAQEIKAMRSAHESALTEQQRSTTQSLSNLIDALGSLCDEIKPLVKKKTAAVEFTVTARDEHGRVKSFRTNHK